MDVVYNHTTAAGQDPKSVLDRIVPGYYQRLNDVTASVETSTCCSNTATEHAMMGKLMIDSVVTWAKDYKVDGFRFDLMGHHSQAEHARRARRAGRADPGQRRCRRHVDLPLRRGLELRRGRRQRPLRPGHAGATWPAPGSAPSTTGCATRCAAADRSTAARAGHQPGLHQRPLVTTPTRRPRQRRSAADQKSELLLSADQIRVGLAGQPGGLRVRRPHRRHA